MGGTVELISRTEDGLYRLPAFIDAHVHVESSHLTPARFGRLIAAQGTLTAVCDPHEIVNVPGVLADDPEVLGKIAAARAAGRRIDGHFPGGRGAALSRYAAAGITSDHESLTADEALEKVAAGMTVFIREGSAAKNLADLLPAVTVPIQ